MEKGLVDNSLTEEIQEFIEFKKARCGKAIDNKNQASDREQQPVMPSTSGTPKGKGKGKGQLKAVHDQQQRCDRRQDRPLPSHSGKGNIADIEDINEALSDVTVYSRAVKLNIPSKGNNDIVKENNNVSNEELSTTIDLLLNNTRGQVEANEVSQRKISSSSEELMDTSDESGVVEFKQHSEFISADRQLPVVKKSVVQPELEPEEIAADLIKDAEGRRATMYEVSGKLNASQIDEDYQMIDNHIDEVMRKRIQRYEFVELGKLLPRNRMGDEDHQRLEIVNRNGMSYLSPVSEREVNNIHSYNKWEQAFRIYTNILTTKYPGKATELLQYNHTIQTASTSYHWENVLAYDREFRRHIARHPYRSWAVILQQAWTMLLKDRLKQDFHKSGSSKGHKKQICKRFNRGTCTFGLSCRYEHRCEVPKCGKFGHGAHICRLRNQDPGYGDKSARDSNLNANNSNNSAGGGKRQH